MATEDLFTRKASNVPEMSVSELAFSLKRTLEEAYGRVRVRGEFSGLKLASSGHLYGDLKDVDSVINIICWRSTLSKLKLKPEDGLEVIVTGRVSSYPKSSRYQIIVESIELAGEGALLKMLEERRQKLAKEGLFDPERKQALPFLPEVIGVITSPTGAVIRDIMHRLADRFPRHVIVWPVAVQGEGAAEQIAAAIKGFNNLDSAQTVKPDLLIVARGGGSLEDLMAFNEETVVRAAAESVIPLISAVGHETDTTLIDYAAAMRAPTPTGAAEIAVPRRLDLLARIMEDHDRLFGSISRQLGDLKNVLMAQSAKLGHPKQILESKTQTTDYLSDRLGKGFERLLDSRKAALSEAAAKIRHPQNLLLEKNRTLSIFTEALLRRKDNLFVHAERELKSVSSLLESYSFHKVLERGFTVIRDKEGHLITKAEQALPDMNIEIEFSGDKRIDATLGKAQKT